MCRVWQVPMETTQSSFFFLVAFCAFFSCAPKGKLMNFIYLNKMALRKQVFGKIKDELVIVQLIFFRIFLYTSPLPHLLYALFSLHDTLFHPFIKGGSTLILQAISENEIRYRNGEINWKFNSSENPRLIPT